MTDLPSTTLGEHADFVMGQAPPGATVNEVGQGTPFYRSGEFGALRPVTRAWTTAPLREAASTDVLVCVVGANAGDINLGIDGAIGRSVGAIRPRSSMDQRFLYYSLRYREPALRTAATGSAQPVLARSNLASIEIPDLSIADQRAIAGVLGAIDDKIVANDRVVAVADKLGRAQFLADLNLVGEPHTTTLGDLAAVGALELGDGYRTKRSEHGPDGFRIVRAGDVSGGRIDLMGTEFVASDYERKIGGKVLRAGDVVLTTKGTVGRVAVVPEGVEPATYSPQLCYFRVVDHNRLDPAYLAGWFKSDDLQAQIAVRMFKSDMAPYVNLQDVRSLEPPLPTIDVQRHIGQQLGALQQLVHTTHYESSRLAATRDELLPLLMSGKVRVKDAEKSLEGVL